MVSESYGGNRKAVIIGLNYEWADSSWDIPKLFGAVADAQRIYTALKQHYDFRDPDIVFLTDSGNISVRPTRTVVLEAIRWLVSTAKSGDTFVLFFAGHAAAAFYPERDRPKWLKSDDILTALCLADGLILNVEIWDLIQYLPKGSSFVFLVDASQGKNMLNLPLVSSKEKPVPFEKDPRRQAEGVRFLTPRAPPKHYAVTTAEPAHFRPGVNAFAITACGASDVAREILNKDDGYYGGLFTSALILAMHTFSGFPVTVLKFFETVQHNMVQLHRDAAVKNAAAPLGAGMSPQRPVLAFSPDCQPESVTFVLPPSAYEKDPKTGVATTRLNPHPRDLDPNSYQYEPCTRDFKLQETTPWCGNKVNSHPRQIDASKNSGVVNGFMNILGGCSCADEATNESNGGPAKVYYTQKPIH